jgi:hypothetical protein
VVPPKPVKVEDKPVAATPVKPPTAAKKPDPKVQGKQPEGKPADKKPDSKPQDKKPAVTAQGKTVNADKKTDPKKTGTAKDGKSTNPTPKRRRNPLPTRYEVPKGAGIGGVGGGVLPDPGFLLEPADIYQRAVNGASRMAGSMAFILCVFTVLLML